MWLSYFPVALLALASVAHVVTVQKRDLLHDLQDQAVDALKQVEQGPGEKKGACKLSNAAVRKNWDYMSADDRKAYISAVQCLLVAPPKSSAVVAGARNRYDDFVAQHINQTTTIHGTGNFLSWHRYFVHGYEKALRNECGYKGHQPYWNWFSYQDDLRASPVFDGSDTSMGGDGLFVKHNGSVGGAGKIFLPSGQGGGCIASGPFKDLQTNLGPLAPTTDGEVKNANPSFGYNPRCVKRDLSTYAATKWLTNTNLHNLTLGPAATSIRTFQDELQGRFDQGFLGLHAGGHYAINGDASDIYSSPNDPAFFLHHTMLDQVWWIWQALHLKQAKTVAGTITLLDNPPSRNATLEDTIAMNYLNLDPTTIEGVLDTLNGETLCYIYA